MNKLDTIINSCQGPDDLEISNLGHHAICKVANPDTAYAHLMQSLLSVLPPLGMKRGPWLAGGALRRYIEETPEYGTWDFDFFFSSSYQYTLFKQHIIRNLRHKLIFQTDRAETYLINLNGVEVTVQLVTHDFYANINHLFYFFDFTNSLLVSDGVTLRTGVTTLQDIKSKELYTTKLNANTATLSVFRRLIKFQCEGYHISNQTLSNFLMYIKHYAQLEVLTAPTGKSDNNK